MQLSFSISYIFEDKDWLQKLLPLVVIGIMSLIPVFGLLAAALTLGFLLQLARNVRQGVPLPLPKWDGDWKVKFEMGGQVLLAILLYHLPLVLLSICLLTLTSAWGQENIGDWIANSFALCCILPMMLLYTLLIWPILAIGVAEFIETDEWERLFRFFHLLDVLRAHGGLVLQWLLYALIVNMVLGILMVIPCLGWLVVLFFGYPVQGHLLGQFAHRLSLVNKPQAKQPLQPQKRPAR